ncbi:hypothetical protein M5689_006435 [Euphorbia peplus]|nr:hypothetical protein M5689_006435 [Euphorbia peplus]
MVHHILLNFKVVFLVVGFNFSMATILVESNISAVESKYEFCKPKNCGNGPNISYPFYVYGNETDYCGHPGFRVHCLDHTPIYKTSAADYIIQDINYERQTFRLVDLQVFTNTTCPTLQQNYSLDRSSVDFVPYHADIFFFYNCDYSVSTNYTVSSVTCNASVINRTYVALVPRDEPFDWNRTACELVVAAPVELDQWEINQTITNIDYKKKLSDGFTLKWIGFGYNCADCQSSGGLCGFEEENSVCYCPDGTHTKHCKDGKFLLLLFYLSRVFFPCYSHTIQLTTPCYL